MAYPVDYAGIRLHLSGLSGWLETARQKDGLTEERIVAEIPGWIRRFERETHWRQTRYQVCSNPDGTYNNVSQTKNVDDTLPLIVEAPYDWFDDVVSDQFLLTTLRERPVISVQRVRVMIAQDQTVFTAPSAWLRVDKRTGKLWLVPYSGTVQISAAITSGALMLSWLGGNRHIPHAISVDYTVGLRDNWWDAGDSAYDPDWADLKIVLQKYCAMQVLEQLSQTFDAGRNSKQVNAHGLGQSVQYSRFEDRIQQLRADVDAFQGIIRDTHTNLLLGVT